jgi:tricorn protease
MNRSLRIIVLAFVAVLVAASAAFSEEAKLLRFPDVSKDKIAFVYAGDIYAAPRSGGTAVRLTSHEGLELFPKFSPDGRMIAFTGQYDGDMSVYVMPAAGGDPRKLVFHPGIQKTEDRFGPENVVMGWHPDGKRVLFRSRKELGDWWDGRAYLVDAEGGSPEALPMATAGFTSFSPDAGKLAYCPIYRDFRTWKRYMGGMAQDVWIFDLGQMKSQKITDWAGTDNLPMWHGDKIYFNSDRTGKLNIFCYDTKSAQTKQVTSFEEFDVRWPSLGPDGIAFENGGMIYILDLPSEQVKKVEISLSVESNWMRPEYVKVSDRIDYFDVSPDVNRAVFSARGDIFTAPKKDGDIRNLTNSSGSDEKDPKWSPNGKWIAFVSDESGEDEFYLMSHDGKERTKLTTDGHCTRYESSWSPDSKKIAFSDKNLDFFYIDATTKLLTKVDKAERNEIRDYSWSPDSRYIAYQKRNEAGIATIFVYSLDDKQIRQVTPGFSNDYSPVFDPDGKYLYFLSERSFNPLLGSYEFEFVNQGIDNLYLILLTPETESPFAPKSDEAKPVEASAADNKPKDEGKKGDEKPKAPEPTKIVFNGIFNRQVAFELPAGNYNGLCAIPGAVFYTSNPFFGLEGKVGEGETVLHKYDISKRKDYAFAKDLSGYVPTPDGANMLVSKAGGYNIIATSGEEADFKDNQLDLSGMEALVDRRAEYRQMFDEVWRTERDFFYDSALHGVDWKAVGDKYKTLLPYATSRYDLTYLIGEMLGELACSHSYVGGGDRPKIAPSGVGLLGVDFEVDKPNNRIKIARILKGENWDKSLRSPLLDPGINVKDGEYLLAINGKQVTAGIDPYSLTVNCSDKMLSLTVNDKPTTDGSRTVNVKPIESEEKLRYNDLVERRRLHVDSVSGGKIGYIHIPDMDGFGLTRFAKMFYYQLRKPALIIDVRHNGGGFVSGLVLERLRRVVVAMGMGRNFAVGPNPDDGLNAHMITLINQFSCSDGDYFPYFFREYGLGPLLGKRTWGGVIGIRGYRPLIDGGYFTAPEFGIFGLDGKWVMENEGVKPDIEVDNLPEREALGYDDQLDRAIEYLTNKLKEDPKTLPSLPPPPKPR